MNLHECIILLSLFFQKGRFHHQKGESDWEETQINDQIEHNENYVCCEMRHTGFEKIQIDRFCAGTV